jgi:hypothetical protein
LGVAMHSAHRTKPTPIYDDLALLSEISSLGDHANNSFWRRIGFKNDTAS